jgi:hypothetical protein
MTHRLLKKSRLLLLIATLMSTFYANTAFAQNYFLASDSIPKAITLSPGNASGTDTITLTFNPKFSNIPTQWAAAHITQVRLHSSVVLKAQRANWASLGWGDDRYNIREVDVPKDGIHATTDMIFNTDGTFSMKYVPADYYGAPGDSIIGISAVIEGNAWSLVAVDSTTTGTKNFIIPLSYRPDAIAIAPANASGNDTVTLTFDPQFSNIPSQWAAATITSVRLRSSVILKAQLNDTIEKQGWGDERYNIAEDSIPKDGIHATTDMIFNGDGTYSMKYVPKDYYGAPGDSIIGISAVIEGNAGSITALDSTSTSIGKTNFMIPLPYQNSFTVHFYKPCSYSSTVNIYYWSNQPAGKIPAVNWPGVKMTSEGNGWYAYTFRNTDATNLIFNDGTHQSADLTRIQQGWYYDASWYDSKPVLAITVTGVTLNPTTATLVIDDTQQLTATVAPCDAADQVVTWSSGSTDIATVSVTGMVTAVAEGDAVITATTHDGAKTATCAVHVNTLVGVNTVNSGNIRIYPVPTSGELNIVNTFENIQGVEVMDLTGQIVQQYDAFNAQSAKLNISGLAKGTYVVRVQFKNSTGVYKIAKN